MRFSIVIPAYNGEAFIRQSVRSALCQTRKADEILVIDDASVDKTAEIARSAEFGNRLKYLYNGKPTGFVDAWNRAIEQARGDFITILHQDDLLHPDFLLHMEKAVLKYPTVRHFYTACSYIDADGKLIRMPPEPHSLNPVLYSGKQYAHNYLTGVVTNNHIHRCPGVLTSRQLLLKQCTYRKEAGHIADDDFFLRVGEFTDIVGISYSLASFRHHAESATSKLDSLSEKLAEAYLFQVRYYREQSRLLDAADISQLDGLAVKFVNLLLYQGLVNDRKDWVCKAFSLRGELEQLKQSSGDAELPLWGRMMWRTASSDGGNLLAKGYAKAVYVGVKLRDALRR